MQEASTGPGRATQLQAATARAVRLLESLAAKGGRVERPVLPTHPRLGAAACAVRSASQLFGVKAFYAAPSVARSTRLYTK